MSNILGNVGGDLLVDLCTSIGPNPSPDAFLIGDDNADDVDRSAGGGGTISGGREGSEKPIAIGDDNDEAAAGSVVVLLVTIEVNPVISLALLRFKLLHPASSLILLFFCSWTLKITPLNS